MLKLSKRAKRNIDWIESHCIVPEGRLVGDNVKLSPAQIEWMEMIYGSPTRMFICSLPRKNGKTTTCAMITLLHLCGPEALPNGSLFSAAQSREQAGILFSLASKMIRMSPSLREFVIVRDTAKELYCPELGTKYKAMSAEASTAYGISNSLTIHDELGQVRGPRSELYEALETSAGAQQSPLTIVISTQATTEADLLSVLIDDALSGADPRIKCVLYSVPNDTDPFDPEVLAKAQPNWHLMNQAEVLKQASDAKRMPSRENSFRNLVCNQRVEAKSPFVSRQVWLDNGDIPHEIDGADVYGGLDLSSVSDLTALVLLSKRDGKFDVNPTFWLPEVGLAEKSRNDRVPYDIWESGGYLQTTPGKSIEYEFVAEYLRGVFDSCNVRALAFDRYNMKFLKPWLERVGFTEAELGRFIEFGQGFVSMSPALRETESLLLNTKLRHGNHPVLSMCSANATVTVDSTGNRKFSKTKQTGRIDGMVALAMAVSISLSGETTEQNEVGIFVL